MDRARADERLLRPVDDAVRVPDAVQRLGLDGDQVYGLIASGELAARKGPDGLVYVGP